MSGTVFAVVLTEEFPLASWSSVIVAVGVGLLAWFGNRVVTNLDERVNKIDRDFGVLRDEYDEDTKELKRKNDELKDRVDQNNSDIKDKLNDTNLKILKELNDMSLKLEKLSK